MKFQPGLVKVAQKSWISENDFARSYMHRQHRFILLSSLLIFLTLSTKKNKMDSWKILISSKSFDIYSAKNYLESRGIETLLQNELSAQAYPMVADTIKILVKEKDIEEGKKILTLGGYEYIN